MITTSFENSVYSITLNRPEKHNAFDAEMIQSVTAAVHDIPADARLTLFSGNGKSFCAGADVSYMRAQAGFSEEQNREDARKLAAMFEAIYQLTVPTVVYAHGNIFGGGLGILAACDIAIAAEDAKFCFSEVRLGIIPAVISPFVLRKTGVGFARRYFQSAEIFSAEIAEKAGLISERISGTKSAETLAKLLAALTAAGRDAQKSVKRLLRSYENFEPMSRDQLIHELAKLRSSEDAQARMKEFLERSKK
ncbi:MAG: enoyl-CoA hydratase/isomerase family protein [Turneriella sp.]|nr:enoyl-CoA hydratase/isomerase family protein [Turneriella sp.]